MKAKETRVARGASTFITKVGASPIPNIERRALERNVSISYAPYKARSQLGQNNGGTRYAMFLLFLSLFGGAL
jgi:hypothetical protein